MQVTVQYLAQLKRALGRAEEPVELSADATLGDLLAVLAKRHGSLASFLDEQRRPSRALLMTSPPMLGHDSSRARW